MAEGQRELGCLLDKIYRDRGFDFREYRITTLTRRLGRRLRAHGAETYADYARVLDDTPGEYDKLFNDLTINVTSFFRDETAFNALGQMVLPALINRNMDTRRGLRVWSAGCATGEEPYSIAMLLLELPDLDIGQRDISILASDIDAEALERAREGRFASKDVQGIRPSWRDRYFITEGEWFRVRPVVKQLVTFEAHNLVSDPPYHDLDLVVCRNVLIYFVPALQTRVLMGIHEGLNESAFLLLGKSEMPVGEANRLFHCLDRMAKLYRKR